MTLWQCLTKGGATVNDEYGKPLRVLAPTKNEAKAAYKRLIGQPRPRSKTHPTRSKGRRRLLPAGCRVHLYR